MNKHCHIGDVIDEITEKVKTGGEICLKAKGTSMKPFIRAEKDSVILSALPEKIKKGDIILYRRENGIYVIHRVMKEKNGEYFMCGDNQLMYERGINRDMMIARISGIKRGDKLLYVDKNFIYKLYTSFNAVDKAFKNSAYTTGKKIKRRIKNRK